MTDLYQHVLKWRVDQPYQLLNREISSRWDWGRGRAAPEVVDDLRNDLANDSQVRVLVAHGANDLVTPYFASQLLLDQLPAYGSAERLKLAVYGGGHMFYNRDVSRRALHDDAEAAYAFAAPGIKALYPDNDTFFAMVKKSYQPVYHPGNYAFGRSRSVDDGAVVYQEVLIGGRDGKDWSAIYELTRQPDGAYKINGVQIVPNTTSQGI